VLDFPTRCRLGTDPFGHKPDYFRIAENPGVIAWRSEMPEALADIDTKDGDIGIADICTRLVQLHLKRRWFLKEIARKDD
jgi:hypothetical protein